VKKTSAGTASARRTAQPTGSALSVGSKSVVRRGAESGDAAVNKARLQGYERDGKLRALQDSVLFLQAQKLGLVALTANVSDYDVSLQLLPTGRALFYRRN